jgi:uncharacterized membrane protein YcaP (DUF421 family)
MSLKEKIKYAQRDYKDYKRKDVWMLVVLVRALVLYILVVIAMRIMGKRQIGQLQPFELVIAIMISELAAVPMQNTGIPLISGIIPILTLLIAQVLMSLINLKSIKARALICGKPSILVENGKIREDVLQKEMYTLHDLLEQLRIKDAPNIKDVEYAILETNGQLSVILKSQAKPVVPADLNIQAKYEGLTTDLIIDGRVLSDNLKRLSYNTDWLKDRLKQNGITDPKDVFYASVDSNGYFYIQKKNRKGGEEN